MASHTFTFRSNSSHMYTQYHPPIDLEEGAEYGLGLISFVSYNSIPNVDYNNNDFIYQFSDEENAIKKSKSERDVYEILPQFSDEENAIKKLKSERGVYEILPEGDDDVEESTDELSFDADKTLHHISIPIGSYEIADLEKYLQNQLYKKWKHLNIPQEKLLTLRANPNSLRVEITSTVFDIFFPIGSLGSLLGFKMDMAALKAGTIYESELPVKIFSVQSIRVNCNITSEAYYGDKATHTVYEFPVSVPPGFSIQELPRNIIYLKVRVSQIKDISIDIVDQNDEFVNFRGEEIIIRFQLKKL